MSDDVTTHPLHSAALGAAPRTWRLAIAVALTYPTLLTLVYFVLLAGFPAGVQQGTYTVGKCLQFLFPVVCVVLCRGQRPSLRWPGLRGVPIGLAFGLAILLAMAALYLGWFRSSAALVGLEAQAMAKVRDLGLDRWWKYAATGLFYALVHSLLEEYYWRWFVFGQLRRYGSLGMAISVSSLGCMAHHVVLLVTFLGWQSPLTYLFSLAVAAGGAVWAWLYASSRSLVGPWLSHMLVDLAIFAIGYDLVRALLAGA